jgi:vesicle coat complex subunit
MTDRGSMNPAVRFLCMIHHCEFLNMTVKVLRLEHRKSISKTVRYAAAICIFNLSAYSLL